MILNLPARGPMLSRRNITISRQVSSRFCQVVTQTRALYIDNLQAANVNSEQTETSHYVLGKSIYKKQERIILDLQ